MISSDSNLTIPSEHIGSNEISKSLGGTGFNTPRESIEQMAKLKSYTYAATKKWNSSSYKIIVETNESAYADTLGNPETAADYR